MIVVMAAVGLMIQAIESNTYNAKEARIHESMKNAAETAADLIAAGNETTCTDITGNHLMNCVDSGGDFSGITGFLADSGYEYYIRTNTSIISQTSDWDEQDFAEVKKPVFVDDVLGDEDELTVRVWEP